MTHRTGGTAAALVGPTMSKPRNRRSRAPSTLGDLVVAVSDRAARHTRRARDRRRLAALMVATALLASGNHSALRRLARAS